MKYVWYKNPTTGALDPVWGVGCDLRSDGTNSRIQTVSGGVSVWHVLWSDGKSGFFGEALLKIGEEVESP